MKALFTLLALVTFTGTTVAEPQPGAPADPHAASAQFTNQGKVLETMDASIYTYIQVTSDKGPVWLAVSKTKVAKGNTIKYGNGAAMAGFFSPSLNRTFDSIIFLDRIEVVKK